MQSQPKEKFHFADFKAHELIKEKRLLYSLTVPNGQNFLMTKMFAKRGFIFTV